MGVPSSQLNTNFSAKYQLSTTFLANSQLTTNFGLLLIFTSYSEYYSFINRIFFTSARQLLSGAGPTKIKV